MKFLVAILSLLPAVAKILDWFSRSPEANERGRIRKAIEARKKVLAELNGAIDEASRGDTSRLDDLINRRL